MTPTTPLALLALGTATAALAAPTNSLPIGGRVFTDIYLPTREVQNSPYQFVDASLWLQADPKLNDKSSAHFTLATDAINSSVAGSFYNQGGNTGVAGGATLRTQLREGYVDYVDKSWEFRVGQQIIPWGKSDAINPTDLISAKDYTIFNPDEEVRRVGAVNAWLGYTPDDGNSPVTLTAILQPVAPESSLLIAPSEIPQTVSFSPTPVARNVTISRTEVALKGAYAGNGWDADAYFFRGYNHLPELVRTSTVPAASVPVAPQFHRQHSAGGDAAYINGKWSYRLETAYIWTENDDGTNPLIIPSHWDSVAGVERPLGDDFRVQAQALYRFFPHWSDPSTAGGPDPVTAAINQGLARANALLLNYQHKSRPGGTFRISYSNEPKGIDAEIFILGNFIGGDYLLRPKLTYAWTDALKTSVGTDYYGGSDDSPLGALKIYNSVFFEAKYTF